MDGLDRWLSMVGSEAAFLALAELIPNAAVVVVDGERRVLHWGGGAERLLGWARDDRLGQLCPDGVICDAGVPRPFGARVRLSRPDGTWVVVQQYTRAFLQPNGARAGAVHLLLLEEGRLIDDAGRIDVPRDALSFHGLLTRDPQLVAAIETIRNVAETDATVLVRGESGTGKELVARAIHRESHRRGGPFVAVNCAAFTPTLLESELFGHKRGAFTGAIADRQGIFAQAHGGTLFLDEVAELPLELQAKLLRVLQERNFIPVGGRDSVSVDVRVVAATHRALREEVRAGRFREDLMYRLRVVPVFLPALRERRLDVDLLLRVFIDEANQRGLRRIVRVAPEVMRVLLDYSWPGNVRELRNVVEYAFAVGRGPELTIHELPPEFREAPRPQVVVALPPAPSPTPATSVASEDSEEAKRILDALAESDGDLVRAAARCGMSRTTFWRRRKALGL